MCGVIMYLTDRKCCRIDKNINHCEILLILDHNMKIVKIKNSATSLEH